MVTEEVHAETQSREEEINKSVAAELEAENAQWELEHAGKEQAKSIREQNEISQAIIDEALAKLGGGAEEEGEGGGRLSLSQMLGDYQPMGDILGRPCGRFYVRKPKLRQRLNMMRETPEIAEGGDFTPVDMMLFSVDLIRHVVFLRLTAKEITACISAGTELRDGMRQATADDLLDELETEQEAMTIAEKVLGVKYGGEKGGAPGSETSPITETSSGGLESDTASPQTK